MILTILLYLIQGLFHLLRLSLSVWRAPSWWEETKMDPQSTYDIYDEEGYIGNAVSFEAARIAVREMQLPGRWEVYHLDKLVARGFTPKRPTDRSANNANTIQSYGFKKGDSKRSKRKPFNAGVENGKLLSFRKAQ